MLPDTWLADLVLVVGSRSAPSAPHDHFLASRWQGKTSQVVSGLRSVAGVLGSDRAQPVPGGRRAHRIGRTRMTPWSRHTAHSSRRRASASRCGNLLQARLRAYWGL
jgi:hypothetical protein